MYSSYLVVLFYCHFIWFYLTCLNLINEDGDGKFPFRMSRGKFLSGGKFKDDPGPYYSVPIIEC